MTHPEALHYDAESRVIYDENRLAVARDVAPDLAAPFCAALAFRALAVSAAEFCPAGTVTVGNEPDLVGYELAKEAHAALAVEADAVEGAIKDQDADPPLWAILDDMLAYEAEQFDGDQDSPLDISGADLVDAFTTWRGQLRAALAARSASLKALERIAARLRGEWHDPTGDLESDIAGEIRKAGLDV